MATDMSSALASIEELSLRAGLSNCVLSTAKLHAAGLALPPIEARLPDLIDASDVNAILRRVTT